MVQENQRRWWWSLWCTSVLALGSRVGSSVCPDGITPSSVIGVTVGGTPTCVYSVATHGGVLTPLTLITLNVSTTDRGQGQGHTIAPSTMMVGLRVEVSWLNGPPTPGPVGLRPNGPTLTALAGGAGVAFELTEPGRWYLEVGGLWQVESFASALMVLVTLPDPDPPSPTDLGVVYFGPGVHRPPGPGRSITIQNDTTVYIAEGAVVLGVIRGNNVHNVTIRGRGILAGSFLPGEPVPSSQVCGACKECNESFGQNVFLDQGSGVLIDGITIVHSSSWNIRLQSLTDVVVRDANIIGWRCWNDGIDIVPSQRVLVERMFIRSDDDCIAIKGMDPTMNTQDVVVRHSILWNQAHGNCQEIGYELWNNRVSNITFDSNFCIHQSGSIASIHNGGHAVVESVLYTNITAMGLDGPPSPWSLQFVEVVVTYGRYSGNDTAKRGAIANVHYDGVTYIDNHLGGLASTLAGNATDHSVSNLKFTSISINGSRAVSLASIRATVNPFVFNVTFDV
eukprot:m.142361 g.142361  ORF g.142361 m.142361 type:complete len:508 (+) comp22918_c0_seq1:117-1640(+)